MKALFVSRVRSHEELPLRTATGDHVSSAWKDLAWNRHTQFSELAFSGCCQNQPWW